MHSLNTICKSYERSKYYWVDDLNCFFDISYMMIKGMYTSWISDLIKWRYWESITSRIDLPEKILSRVERLLVYGFFFPESNHRKSNSINMLTPDYLARPPHNDQPPLDKPYDPEAHGSSG